MSIWLLAVLGLLPAFVVPVLSACRGGMAQRLVAAQLATGTASLILALMTFAFDQTSFIDLALCAALLTLPGTLLMTVFVERWL
jgi:multisubunit Na+/H+ antiporter MnhF subunit